MADDPDEIGSISSAPSARSRALLIFAGVSVGRAEQIARDPSSAGRSRICRRTALIIKRCVIVSRNSNRLNTGDNRFRQVRAQNPLRVGNLLDERSSYFSQLTIGRTAKRFVIFCCWFNNPKTV